MKNYSPILIIIILVLNGSAIAQDRIDLCPDLYPCDYSELAYSKKETLRTDKSCFHRVSKMKKNVRSVIFSSSFDKNIELYKYVNLESLSSSSITETNSKLLDKSIPETVQVIELYENIGVPLEQLSKRSNLVYYLSFYNYDSVVVFETFRLSKNSLKGLWLQSNLIDASNLNQLNLRGLILEGDSMFGLDKTSLSNLNLVNLAIRSNWIGNEFSLSTLNAVEYVGWLTLKYGDFQKTVAAIGELDTLKYGHLSLEFNFSENITSHSLKDIITNNKGRISITIYGQLPEEVLAALANNPNLEIASSDVSTSISYVSEL